MQASDVVVVGAGLVGSALAWGLARQNQNVTILDEGDDAFRASRGNFGLVWIQGKGYGLADYARWSKKSAAQWPQLAKELKEQTGINVSIQQPGGLYIALSDDELKERVRQLTWIQERLGEKNYSFDVLEPKDLKKMIPAIGPTVSGGIHSKMDGHVNPLRLLQAFHKSMHENKVQLYPAAPVQKIEYKNNRFVCETPKGQFTAEKLVLAAGLGNKELGKQVDIHAPVEPNRGQVLITE